MSLWWFARRCRIRKTALPGLLPMVWLAATAISGVNASAFHGLSNIWCIIPDSSVISECSTSLTDICKGWHPLLELRVLHRCPVGKKPRPCLPITPAILQKIFQFWSRTPHQYEYILQWAAFCLVFFGFMRSGEFTCPSMSAFTFDLLTAQDISVVSRVHPSYIVNSP